MLSVKVGTRLDPREAKSILSKQRILCFFKVYISVKKQTTLIYGGTQKRSVRTVLTSSRLVPEQT